MKIVMKFLFWFSDENNCVPNPCQNGGQCVDLIGGFECNCANGFQGTLCDEGSVCY